MKTELLENYGEPQLSGLVSSAPLSDAPLYLALTSPYSINPSIEQIIMKALFKNVPVFLLTLGLLFLVGCASTAKHEGTGEYIDDSVITARVKAAILAEDSLKVAEINVETYKGIVQLSGFISSMENQYKAVKVAKGISGVKSVKNDMRAK